METMGHILSKFKKSGDQVYLVLYNFCDCRVPYLRASFSGIEKVLCIWVRVRVGDRVQIRDQVRVHVWFQPGVKSGSVLSLTLTLTRVQNQTQNGVWTIAVKALCNCISPGPDPSPNSQLES